MTFEKIAFVVLKGCSGALWIVITNQHIATQFAYGLSKYFAVYVLDANYGCALIWCKKRKKGETPHYCPCGISEDSGKKLLTNHSTVCLSGTDDFWCITLKPGDTYASANLAIIGLSYVLNGVHLVPSHCLNQWLFVVNWTPMGKSKWK